MRLGLLLPHFGPYSSYDRLFDLGARLQDLGFSSAWVRDQLGFRGLPFEPRSHHFVDPFITLAAIAASSELTVGTATLAPIRQPVVVAQLVGSLAYLARGRLVLGIGMGGQPRAFQLAGMPWEQREQLFRETVEVIRAVSRPGASYQGQFARFDDLTLDPAPPEDLELWYCGSSLAAIQRALDYCTGWFPGRCPFGVYDRLLARLREGAAELGVSPRLAIVPLLSLGRDRRAALEKVNVPQLLAEANEKKAWRRDGPFQAADDLRGALIAGSVDDVIAELDQFRERGVDEVVLDLRQSMDVFEETIERLGREVFPHFAG